MATIVWSFLVLTAIPIAVVCAIAGIRAATAKRALPPLRELAKSSILSVVITVAISLGMTLILQLSGYFESQFFRPSSRAFDELESAGVEYRECAFESGDGTRLHGYFLPSTTKPAIGTVIHFHGSDLNVTFTAKNAAWLVEHEIQVFAFDYRGYGKSEGTPGRAGIIADGVAAIEYACGLAEVDPTRVVLWGQSMGGQCAINAAIRSGKQDLDGVVAEATYASFRHHLKDKLAQMGPLWLVAWAGWLLSGDEHAAIDTIAELAPVPLLLVHGSADRVVMPYHSEWLLAAAREPKLIWRAKGGGHLRVFRRPENQKLLLDYLREAFR